MKRPPRMLRQVYTSRQTGDAAVDALRWGASRPARKRLRPTPAPKTTSVADRLDDVCRWLDEDGET